MATSPRHRTRLRGRFESARGRSASSPEALKGDPLGASEGSKLGTGVDVESLAADTEAIDVSWEGDSYREPSATLLDVDPLRHDSPEDSVPRSQADTLPDSDPLRYDLTDSER